MAKKLASTEAPRRQAYIALTAIEGDTEQGTIRWLPGSLVWMSDETALIYLAKGGIIEPAEGTIPPTLPKPPLTIVEAGQSADWDSGALVAVEE